MTDPPHGPGAPDPGSDPDPFLAEPAVRAALAAARPDATPTGAEPLGRGNRKRTRLVRFAGRAPAVVQVAEAEGGADLRTEAALLAAVAERTGVPVPAVLAAGAVGGVSYLVTDYVAGADLHEQLTALDSSGRLSVIESLGGALAALHEAFRFERYGAVTVGDPDGSAAPEPAALRATAEDWPAWFTSYGLDAVARLPAAFDDLRPRLRRTLTGPPDPGTARLFPWDFRPGNAVVADGEVAALLDWEAPLSAPAALSAAKAEYLTADWYADADAGGPTGAEQARKAFRSGYRSVRPWPDVRPAHRVAAVAASAVDSRGRVTVPGWPERDREAAVAFHRSALERALG